MGSLKISRIAYHVLFWLVYLPLNASLSSLIQGASVYENFFSGITGELSVLPVKITLAYFIFYYLIPLYMERSKAIRLILILVLAFGVGCLAYRLVDSYIYLPLFRPELAGRIPVFSLENIILALFDLFITTTAAVSIKMIRVRYSSVEYEQELIREKLQSELDFLRAQTNPHFLFNTLNNLYGLARKKSDKAPDAIMMLSKILRFMLYDCRAHRIPVANEAKVIKDYIELEKLRYNDRLKVVYEEDLDRPNALIAPLLLLPFVENSFKHGAHSSTDEAAIHIRLFVKDNVLDFSVENTFDNDKGTAQNGNRNGRPNTEVGGIGINNEKRQLDLIYPDRHELTISESDGWYRAKLQVQLEDGI